MIKLALALAVALAATTATTARADDAAKRAEAQKKLDEAKIKGCEGVKTYLAKQAKSCPDQAAAAAKVTCSAAAFAEMNALNTACAKVLKDKSAATVAKATAPKPPADPKATACKITDDAGAAVAETTGSTLVTCMKDAKTAAKARCAPGVKKVKLTYQFADRKPLTATALCPK